jgi:hypothetical protein
MAWNKECSMKNLLISMPVIALLLLSAQAVPAASPPVGLTVYAEEWNPTKSNGEALKVLENNPTLMSDTLNSAWRIFSQWYLATIPSQIHAQNYLNKVSNGSVPTDITLYSHGGNTNLPPEMSFPQQVSMKLIPGGGMSGMNTFRAEFFVPGSSISLCSTVPTLARSFDPCIELSVDVTFSLGLQVSDVPSQMIKVNGATVSLSNFKYGKANWSTDVALAVSEIMDFLGGPNFTAMIVHTIDSTKINVTDQIQKQAVDVLNAEVYKYEQQAMTAINQQLQPYASVSRLVHLAVWAQNPQSAQNLNLLFAPPAAGVTIDPSRQTGQISGTLTFDNSVTTVPACSSFNTSPQIVGQVQVGPRPIVAMNSSNPVYGDAPLQGLAVAFVGGALQGRQCPYTLSRLALGLPNILNFSNIAYRASSQASVKFNTEIEPAGWANPVVLGPNNTVLYAGTVSASQPTFARTLAPMNATAFGPTTTSAPSAAPSPQQWGTTVRQDVQPVNPQSNLHSLNLTASLGVSVHNAVGLVPRQGTVGGVSPVDPAANQAKTTWGASPQAAATAVPTWGAAPTAAAPATLGTSLQRGATLNRSTSLKTQQQTAPTQVAAPQTLQAP